MGTSAPICWWKWRISSSRGRLRLVTISRDGRLAPCDFCSMYQVTAMADPPAPSTRASAPVRSQCRGGQEGLQGQAAGDRVLGVPDQAAVVLRDAADLAHQLGEVVEPVELVAAGAQQVELVRGDQGPERERIVLDELHRPAIVLRLVVPAEVHAPDRHVAQPQVLGPARERPS